MNDHRESDILRRALALYAGEHVLAKVDAEGERFLALHAHSLELTMLFLDVASFTLPQKSVTAESLREWSATYSEAVTATIANAHGTFDTFIGNAASAWWGEDHAIDHPAKAIACARVLLSAIDRLNSRHAAQHPSIGLMVGVHTGRVALGNFGSSTRLRYCPIGDAVNLTSRLCSLSNTYRKPVILSEATYRRLDDHANIEPLASVSVKGQAEPLQIYGLGSN